MSGGIGLSAVAGIASGGGLGGFFTSILTNVITSALAPSAPSPAALPAAPAPAEVPKAPAAVTKAGPEPVIDTEAAGVRARKRRAEAAGKRRLLGLATEDDSVLLSRSLLGE